MNHFALPAYTPTGAYRLLLCCVLLGALPASAHDYPTTDRVTWVQNCMQEHPGHYFEMVNKCSCTIDRIAREVSYDDFTTMNTAVNASSIGGERGGSLRASDTVQQRVRQYRALQKQAKAACFIQPADAAKQVAAPAASAP